MQPDQNPNIYTSPPAPSPVTGGDPQPNYGFILKPEAPKWSPLGFLSGGSTIKRLIVLLGGLLILLIIFAIIKSALTTSAYSKADFLTVLKQQSEIVHIVSVDLANSNQEQASLSTTSSNFATTAQLVVGSAQTQTLAYLKANHYTIKQSSLQNIFSKTTDTQLSNALTTSNFNQTFDQVMQSELTTYAQDLSRAYNSSHGKKGRALLKSEYASVQLLVKQLNLPAD